MSAESEEALSGEIRWAALRAFTDPLRLRILFAGGAQDAAALATFLFVVVPAAKRAIARLERLAHAIPDPAIRAKALHGLRAKAYHIAGACVFATFLPKRERDAYIAIVAPLETIYDFLDTIGDGTPAPDERASRRLHAALADALDPDRPRTDYFALGPHPGDGGFLAALVHEVRSRISAIPGRELITRDLLNAAQLYADTQTLKHLPPGERETASEQHFREAARAAGVSWFEYAAAAGSQLHVYAPLFALFCGNARAAQASYDAYFPEAGALHVLLDAFIDRDEDLAHGELNWIDCFPTRDEATSRFGELARRCERKIETLPSPAAHRFSLRLMLLFYLTHPKVWRQRLQPEARRLLRLAGREMS